MPANSTLPALDGGTLEVAQLGADEVVDEVVDEVEGVEVVEVEVVEVEVVVVVVVAVVVDVDGKH
jgi:hypothetical protein